MPGETQKSFTPDGYFLTGDLAMIDDHGYIQIIGRRKDLIIRAGTNVTPKEVEDVLRTHADIEECAVVGVEDEEWGQRVAAAVVLRHGCDLQLESLRTWCKTRLATYKVPSLLQLVSALPRNPMGKVTKPDIVNQFES